jgi:C-type lectin domain family 3 protein B
VLLALGGCRQLFGIEDTDVGDDVAGADAPADGAGNPGPDAVTDAPAQPDATPDATPVDASVCVALYTLQFGPHRYQLGSNNTSWDNAQASCAANGGYLAIPDDLAENEFIRNLNAGQLWLGITDRMQEGTWVTLAGETVPPHFDNWGQGLPNGGNDENCVQILTSAGGQDGDWDDSDCPNDRRAICECDP